MLKASDGLTGSESISTIYAKTRWEDASALIASGGFKLRDANRNDVIECPPRPVPASDEAPGPCWSALSHMLHFFRGAWSLDGETPTMRLQLGSNGFWIGIEPELYVLHVLGFDEDARLVGLEYLVNQRHE